MQRNKLTLIALIFVVVLGGYFGYTKIYLPHKFSTLTEKLLSTALASLDDDALAGQVIHIAIPGTELGDDARKIIAAIKPGGIIFFGFNLQSATQIKTLTDDLQAYAAELKLPPFLISTDQEGGYVKRVPEGVLLTPPARDLGATKDPELCFATGFHVSRDLGKLGINVFFAPIVDINNNPKNPVIGLRSFGDTLEAVIACALPFERGARRAEIYGGAMPVIKHFPGHGDTQVDSHWALPVINKDLNTLRNFELIPFAKAIADGAHAVMTAHILYPQIDKERPATLSHKWLTETLRTELKFSGLIFTDAMEMNALSKHFPDINRPLGALEAGADVLLYTSWQEDPVLAKKQLIDALTKERASIKRATLNQLRAKLSLISAANYLEAGEASFYTEYRREVQSKMEKEIPPAKFTDTEVKEKFRQIKWSTKVKKGGPIWLAGRKNAK